MKTHSFRRRLLGILILGCLLFFMLRWFEHSQVYHPSRAMDALGIKAAGSFEDVSFRSKDGVALNGWYFAAITNSPRSRLAVVICHGNGGNISHRVGLYQALLQTGVGVFAFDYRGFGRSQGRPSEEGTYLDAQAAYAWLKQKGFEQIIVYGESLGGAIASEVCVREKAAGLILQGAFTSIPDIGAKLFPFLPVRWLARIQYDTRSKLQRLNLPVLVMHSRGDRLIPFEFAQTNFAAAKEPKFFWEISGGHNDAVEERERFIEGVENFLQLVESAH